MKSKFKKVACIGTHSVGKSTLCYQLALDGKKRGENVHVIQERVRFSPFPINEKMVYETAIWACTNQISKELEAQQKGFSLIICDRSAYDPFIYAEYNKLSEPLHFEFEEMAVEWTKTYDEIYFVRPNKDHVPSPDGVRDTHNDFIREVDRLFVEFIEKYRLFVKTIYTNQVFTCSMY